MQYDIIHQISYSRKELVLRTILGIFYLALPHLLILFFLSIASFLVGFLAWGSILHRGNYPLRLFKFQVRYMAWRQRLNARLHNLCDGYPAFGLKATDDHTRLHIPYPESLSRIWLIVRTLFSIFYVLLPHGTLLFFRFLASLGLEIAAWWVVLFSGEYPPRWHAFNLGTLRWAARVDIYLLNLTDKYPPFHGRPT
jgi:hypothetical protein